MAPRTGILRLRWSYNNVDKDPEVDVFRGIYQKEHIKEDDLAAMAGLATSTVKNLFGGQTRKPQHLTYHKLASAMGYAYKLSRNDNERPNYEVEVEKAKEERRAYREALRKKKERAAARNGRPAPKG